jgi:hypothetical protein
MYCGRSRTIFCLQSSPKVWPPLLWVYEIAAPDTLALPLSLLTWSQTSGSPLWAMEGILSQYEHRCQPISFRNEFPLQLVCKLANMFRQFSRRKKKAVCAAHKQVRGTQMLDNCFSARVYPSSSPHITITMTTVEKETTSSCSENARPQNTILHALRHNYNCINCDSEIAARVCEVILLK